MAVKVAACGFCAVAGLVKRLMDGAMTLRHGDLQPLNGHFRYRHAIVYNKYRTCVLQDSVTSGSQCPFHIHGFAFFPHSILF
jgi:hypothetical protein